LEETRAELEEVIAKRKEHERELFKAEDTCKQLQPKIVK
jgi:hypothetical protein